MSDTNKTHLDAIDDPLARTEKDGGVEETRQDMQLVTTLFAQQNLHDNPASLREVPSHDREMSLYDVHGVLKPIEETPAWIEENIMHVEVLLLDVQPIANNPESTLRDLYEQASHNFPEYTTRLILSCLRADRFDVEKAAHRVLRHIQTKYRFFGEHSVGRDLGLKDLGELERRALDDGVVQVLNKRDRSGRAIIVQFKVVAEKYPPGIVAKLLFWSGTMAALDEKVQKCGFVYIMCSFEGTPAQNHRLPLLFDALVCTPIRFAAMHFCTDDFSKMQACTDACLHIETQILCRSLSHFGTTRQCRNNLLTFGIPLDALPVQDDGVTLDLTSHKRWIARLVCLQENLCGTTAEGAMKQLVPFSPIIEEPELDDVVLGRGTKWVNHPGNQRLKRLLEEKLSPYNIASRLQKATIINQVYSTMTSEGSRFMLLEISNGMWIEVSEGIALDRVAHGFRNLRKKP